MISSFSRSLAVKFGEELCGEELRPLDGDGELLLRLLSANRDDTEKRLFLVGDDVEALD